MAFDNSLSFLEEVDDTRVGSAAFLLSPRLSCDATTELLEDLLGRQLEVSDDDITSRDALPRGDGSETVAPSSSSPRVPVPPVKTTRKSTKRVRPNQAIAYLRTQVRELEDELTCLRQKAAREADPATEKLPCMWQRVAERQLDEKLRVQVENAKLREMLEGQLRVARSLETLLQKREITEAESFFTQRKRVRGSTSEEDLEAAARAIRARITTQFDELALVLEECGVSRTTADTEDARARIDTNTVICMELTNVKVLPFEWRTVADAAWQCTKTRIGKPSAIPSKTDSELSEMLTEQEFYADLHVRRSAARIYMRGVSARRDNPKRSLSVFENAGIVEGPLVAGMHIKCRERGFIVIEEGPSSSSTVSPSTVVRACSRMWPEAEVGDSSSDSTRHTPEVGLFVDLVLGLYNQRFKAMLQSIENTVCCCPNASVKTSRSSEESPTRASF